MLICEDLFLLLTTDEGGQEPWVTYRDYGLAAGLLSDLTLAGCLTIHPSVRGSGLKVSLAEDSETRPEQLHGLPAPLAFGLTALSGRKPTKVSTVVTAGWFNPRESIVESLTAQGVVGKVEKKFLGFVPEKHPTLNGEPEVAARARLTAALRGDAGGMLDADQASRAIADAVILSVLKGLSAVQHVLKEETAAAGLNKRQAVKRIDEIVETVPEEAAQSGKAVKSAIDGINAAITASVALGVVTTGSAST